MIEKVGIRKEKEAILVTCPARIIGFTSVPALPGMCSSTTTAEAEAWQVTGFASSFGKRRSKKINRLYHNFLFF